MKRYINFRYAQKTIDKAKEVEKQNTYKYFGAQQCNLENFKTSTGFNGKEQKITTENRNSFFERWTGK